MRRLIPVETVAEKLSYSASWFDKNRDRLEKTGFPKPVLNRDIFGGRRWDEAAIDAWMDTHMDETLLAHRNAIPPAHDIDAITRTLEHRARELAL